MSENEYKSLFISEAREHLAEIFMSINKIEKGTQRIDEGLLFDMFRRFHTLKGMANTMGATRIGELAHSLEDLLDLVRKYPESYFSVVEFIRRGLSSISSEIDNFENGLPPASEEMLRELEYVVGETKKRISGAERSSQTQSHSGSIDLKGSYELVFEPESTCKTPSVRAFMLLKALSEKGRVLKSEPSIEDLKRGIRFLSIRVYVSERLDEETIGEVLKRTGEMRLISSQPYTHIEAKEKRVDLVKYIRVPFERIEEITEGLDNLVLLWNKYRYSLPPEVENPKITRIDYSFKTLINYAGRLRTIPASSMIPKLSAIVESTSKLLNKKVRLSVVNESIEIDKGIIDRLEEPLLHLIKNCIYHGIESIDERLSKGKGEMGNIEVSFKEGDEYIEIKVSDDGRGIDIDRIKEVALEKGIAKVDEIGRLSEKEIIEFIFIPGFSTLRDADMTSGRGVGMDVVRNVVWQLGGDITIESVKDRGTKFVLMIPYQFALKRVLICSVGGINYAFSLNTIKGVVDKRDVLFLQEKRTIKRESDEFYVLNTHYESPQMYLLFSFEKGDYAIGIDDIVFIGETRLYKTPYILKSSRFLNGMVIMNGICPIPILSIDRLVDERNI
jgi:two-component system chemotaxis sensor kinase CheA